MNNNYYLYIYMTIIEELLRKKKLEKTPIWLMRQAGRYMKEYMTIKNNRSSFLNMCYTPEIAAQITMQPIEKFDFDAAIIFSDILVIPNALGLNLNFVGGSGPELATISSYKDLNDKAFGEILEPVYEALSIASSKLQDKSLIGFAGAPWTLFAYMVDGNSKQNFAKALDFIKSNRNAAEDIIKVLIEAVSKHLIKQIEAGANVVQIFDSWAGLLVELEPSLYEDFVIRPTQKIVEQVKAKFNNVPIIGFPRGSKLLYEQYAKQTGVDILSIDQDVDLKWAVEKLKNYVIIQGNLDPTYLLNDQEQIEKEVARIINTLGKGEFIFNLGHGVLPTTPIENVQFLVNEVRKYNI